MDDKHIRPLARIIARLNAAYKAGTISFAQWGRLVSAAMGEFK
jgi:hypothetical protein